MADERQRPKPQSNYLLVRAESKIPGNETTKPYITDSSFPRDTTDRKDKRYKDATTWFVEMMQREFPEDNIVVGVDYRK